MGVETYLRDLPPISAIRSVFRSETGMVILFSPNGEDEVARLMEHMRPEDVASLSDHLERHGVAVATDD